MKTETLMLIAAAVVVLVMMQQKKKAEAVTPPVVAPDQLPAKPINPYIKTAIDSAVTASVNVLAAKVLGLEQKLKALESQGGGKGLPGYGLPGLPSPTF